MSVLISILGSSSAGNCYILESDGHVLVVECGVRYKEIQRGLGYNYRNVAGCLITHEHMDHAKAIFDVARAGIKCYASEGTISALCKENARHNTIPLEAMKTQSVGKYDVLPFLVNHDAEEPLGFVIKAPSGETVLFMTDTRPTKYKVPADLYMVECNYCRDRLEENAGKKFMPRKAYDRIVSNHLEMEETAAFLEASAMKGCAAILLHLSDGNSDEERMIKRMGFLNGGVAAADKGKKFIFDKRLEVVT